MRYKFEAKVRGAQRDARSAIPQPLGAYYDGVLLPIGVSVEGGSIDPRYTTFIVKGRADPLTDFVEMWMKHWSEYSPISVVVGLTEVRLRRTRKVERVIVEIQ